METFYVQTDDDSFTKHMKDYLKKLGLKEKTSFPIKFIFLQGEASYQRNKVNTKRSQWISLLWGKSVDRLTDKVELHQQTKPYLIPSVTITDSSDLPSFRSLKILKPLGGFSGSGIRMVDSTSDAKEWMESHKEYKSWLLQSYIKTPALKDGYKFHLRVYLLIKKEQNKEKEVFISNHKLYVKAKEKYRQDDWFNPKIHDTHYKPGKLETFPQELPDDWTADDGKTTDTKISKLLVDLLKDEHEFHPSWNAVNGFEVFGIDILFDKKKPYLLEFNNKIGIDRDDRFYIPGFVNTVLTNTPEPYFTRIV